MSEDLRILVPVSSIGRVLRHLQCPLCREHMTQPIFFCDNGHNVCFDCKDAAGKCLTCGRPFSGIRNISLEQLCVWSSISCPFAEQGCEVMCPHELIADHIATCAYKKATCPCKKALSLVCSWEGLLKDMVSHCKESHQSHFYEGPYFKSSSTKDAVKIILNDDGEVFIYNKRFKDGKLYCAVQKVGISQTLHSATFILRNENCSDEITVTRIVPVISENLDVLLQSGKFLKLSDKLLKRFICDGRLPLQVVISNVKTKK